ncbi:MAG TPA: sulfite oxidase-like oxidoreductase [Aliidongia sp.]|nr:sulfite oxidase-like oxidoreductase [Aliidongia sp.]
MDRDKLIAAKEKWARDKRLIDPSAPSAHNRLPPGQHLVRDWPVLDLGTQPHLSQRDWRLTVGGLVANPVDWGWQDFAAFQHTQSVSDIHCVTAWSRYDNRWGGISGADFLKLVQPLPDAKFLRIRSFDSYSTNIPLADFAAEGVMLASHWQGEPLIRAHGGPVRLIVPQLYLWKSAKWLRHIWFTDRDAPGFWEARGYHMRGDPWRQERYSSD